MIGEFSRYFILDTSIGHLRMLWSAIKTSTVTQVIIKESFFIFWAQNQQSCSEVSSYLNSLRLLLFSITTHNNVIGTSFAKKETDFRRQTSFSIREINAYKMLLTCFELLMDKRRKNNFCSRCILNKRTDFKSGYVSFSRLSFAKPLKPRMREAFHHPRSKNLPPTTLSGKDKIHECTRLCMSMV